MFTMLFPVLLKVVGFALDRSKASRESKRAFFAMVEKMGTDGLISVKLHESYKEQIERLEADAKTPPTQ